VLQHLANFKPLELRVIQITAACCSRPLPNADLSIRCPAGQSE
jgi:hypothetical protein